MKNFISNLYILLLREEVNLAAYGLLILVGFSTLGNALFFVPADPDDLILLSSVANTQTPIIYFFGDWGLGNNAYRPIHSITIWLSYQLFGIYAGYNQLLNLILHFTIVCLLFRLIRRVQSDIIISFLLASLSLVSIYTMSPATWVSDRPSLFVALFFLLLLNHLYNNGQPEAGRVSYIVILSILALMSKESGLIVPLLAIYHAIQIKKNTNHRTKVIISTIAIIVAYGALRVAIFGSQANSYTESGYVFGSVQYKDWHTLPKYIQYYAVLENVTKNLIAPFLPIFNGQGKLLSVRLLAETAPFWLLTSFLVLLTTQKKLSVFQKLALVIIALNSIIHYSVFRYRTQYIPQLAVSIFIASSTLINNDVNRKMLVKTMTTALLLFSIVWASRSLTGTLLSRYQMLENNDLEPIIQEYPSMIDNQIIIRVLQRYTR